MRALIIFILLLSLPAFSNSFEKANQLYQKQDFIGAKKLYINLLEQGFNNWELHYNLGNCYFKTKEVAPAILHWEKALLRNTNCEDCRYNISIANLSTIDKIEPLPSFFLRTILQEIRGTFTSENWAILTNSFAFLALLGWLLFMGIVRQQYKKPGMVLLLSAGIFTLISYALANSQQNFESRKFAVVFAPNAYIKHAPSKQSADAFILHAGTKFETLDKVANWTKIRLADGKIGWIQNDLFSEI